MNWRQPNWQLTRPKQVRIPDDDWDAFRHTAGERQRATVLLAFIRWYNREPGAKLPDRPPRER